MTSKAALTSNKIRIAGLPSSEMEQKLFGPGKEKSKQLLQPGKIIH